MVIHTTIYTANVWVYTWIRLTDASSCLPQQPPVTVLLGCLSVKPFLVCHMPLFGYYYYETRQTDTEAVHLLFVLFLLIYIKDIIFPPFHTSSRCLMRQRLSHKLWWSRLSTIKRKIPNKKDSQSVTGSFAVRNYTCKCRLIMYYNWAGEITGNFINGVICLVSIISLVWWIEQSAVDVDGGRRVT